MQSHRRRCALVVVLSLCSLGAGLGSIGLWGIREKRVAACVADVLYGNDWLLPQLRDELRLEKPPLPYWIIAGSALVSGATNEWSLRVPGMIAALSMVWAVGVFGRELGGYRAGVLSSLFLATSLFFIIEARQASSDLYLACFTTLALLCWWRGYVRQECRLVLWTCTGACVGLGILCKGPVALAVIVPTVVGFLAWRRELGLPRNAGVWLGIVLAFSFGASWPVAVWIREPHAWSTWLLELDRKALHAPAWGRGWFYYLLQWPSYLFPWSGFAMASGLSIFSRYGRKSHPLTQFAWLWFFGNLCVFTLAVARKNYYLLPAVPGLAILSGDVATRLQDRLASKSRLCFDRLLVHVQMFLLLALAVGLACCSMVVPSLCRFGVVAAMFLAWVILVLWIYITPETTLSSWVIASLCVAATTGLAYRFVLPRVDADLGPRAFVEQISGAIPSDEPLYYVGEVDPALWFYLHDRLHHLPSADQCVPGRTYYFVAPANCHRKSKAIPEGSHIIWQQHHHDTDSQKVLLCRYDSPTEASRVQSSIRVKTSSANR